MGELRRVLRTGGDHRDAPRLMRVLAQSLTLLARTSPLVHQATLFAVMNMQSSNMLQPQDRLLRPTARAMTCTSRASSGVTVHVPFVAEYAALRRDLGLEVPQQQLEGGPANAFDAAIRAKSFCRSVFGVGPCTIASVIYETSSHTSRFSRYRIMHGCEGGDLRLEKLRARPYQNGG
jgi:hypothetical protein